MYGCAAILPKLLTGSEPVFELVALLLIPLVLVRRKEPSSTIAWILTLLFMPAFGAMLFLLFGRDRVRWPAQRKRQADALVRAQVAAATDGRAMAVQEIAAPGASELGLALFRIGAHLTHIRPRGGNRVDVLTDGNEAYEALGAAFDAAVHHIHAEVYLIRDDATGAWFRERLIAAALRGVRVRLLCDGFGCLALGARWARPLRRVGVEVVQFLPMRSVLLQPVNLRNHRKIVVVDGHIAFTGGLNVGDEYRGQMRGVGRWRDVHLRIEGPASRELQRVFFQDWAYAKGLALDPTPYFPDRANEPAGDATVAIVPSGPDTRTEAIHRLFFGAIAGAKDRVLITTPYFVPDQALTVALGSAPLRGVDVKIILPSRSNHKVTFHAGRSYYQTLLETGVKIYEYEPGIVHAKTMIVDGTVSLVGSANMDMRSFRLNFEVHALIHDPATACKLEAQFASDLASSRRIQIDEWRVRSRMLYVLEGASRLVSPLL